MTFKKTNKPKKRKLLRIFLWILAIFGVYCLISILVSYNFLTVSYFTVTDSKIAEPFRVVLISDLHDHRFGSKNQDLIELIAAQEPDIIVLDGDMINGDSESAEAAVELIAGLKSVADVYYSLGNHEYEYIENVMNSLSNPGADSASGEEAEATLNVSNTSADTAYTSFISRLESAGAIVLNHECLDIEINGNAVRLGGLYEYGFETGMQSDEDNAAALSYLEEYSDTDRYLLMCAHRPESFYCWDWADKWGIDLVLSGHLHGGQVIIPGVGGLYSPLEQYFPKYDYGRYELGESDMIITRGLSSDMKALPRFNNPPEVAVVDIKPE